MVGQNSELLILSLIVYTLVLSPWDKVIATCIHCIGFFVIFSCSIVHGYILLLKIQYYVAAVDIAWDSCGKLDFWHLC